MAKSRSKERALSPTVRRRLTQVKACERSGESLKSYAKRHGLSVHTLYQAKKLARRQGVLPPHRGKGSRSARSRNAQRAQPTPFVEVVARAPRPEGPAAWRLRFAGGEVLESRSALGIDEVRTLIDALRRRP